MRKLHSLSLLAFILFVGCKSGHDINNNSLPPIELDVAEVVNQNLEYHASKTKLHDLIHTRLDVQFDWQKHHLLGRATLTLKPYFYPSDSLLLDAKGFDIHSVQLLTDSGCLDLEYQYDGWLLDVTLNREYSRTESYQIIIDYTAKPDDLPVGGSKAILADKGLYFINSDSTEVGKPTQIWTQGETESSSCWFPTIDSPNERTTQEMYITVDDAFRTLSNGELVYSNFNADGTRTDYWKMDLPHPPYLFMMAIGDYKVSVDQWANSQGEIIPVDYWMEREYADYAYKIFGNTPEMMSFFSDILDYDYPWPKYSQVIVRDYVSGAMENTTATIHGEFLNATDRDLLDGNDEDVIAHELFHHWFGDLVTCESWANLALNESFATYSEYLWDEYKYGSDAADYSLMNFRLEYFDEALNGPKKLIRYNYADKEDMFDAHSYQKGGCILHMLRALVGDDAFFASLHTYLVENQFQDAEVHHLRLAFEKVTGIDLQEFFDQWFLGSGHPKIEARWEWDETHSELVFHLNQTQEEDPFSLMMPIKVYFESGSEPIEFTSFLEDREEVFSIPISQKPKWVSFDYHHDLLAEINSPINAETACFQFEHAEDLFDRINALQVLSNEPPSTDLDYCQKLTKMGLKDPHEEVVLAALYLGVEQFLPEEAESLVLPLLNHQNTEVQGDALVFLAASTSYNKIETYEKALQSRSYYILASGLEGLSYIDSQKALKMAETLENEDSFEVIKAVSNLYAGNGGPDKDGFFRAQIIANKGYMGYICASNYGDYLALQNHDITDAGINLLIETQNSRAGVLAFGARQGLKKLQMQYTLDVEKGNDEDKSYKKEKLHQLSEALTTNS